MSANEEYTNSNLFINLSSDNQNKDSHNSTSSRTDFMETNSLEKVRDILFGTQMREVDKKISRLEERLTKDFNNLQIDTRKQLDSLENYIKQEVESLSEKIKQEQNQREQVVNALADGQKNISTSLERKLIEFDEQSSVKSREIREQIFNQSKTLHDEIRQKYEDILTLLEREAQEIRHEKTDRSTLAALFTELAIRLNSQP
jgi:phage gp36-like protein